VCVPSVSTECVYLGGVRVTETECGGMMLDYSSIESDLSS
jgi:hypothetical protein